MEDRLPVIVATGHAIERDEVVSALDLALRAAEVAFEHAPALRARIDTVSVVNILSRSGPEAARQMAGRLGLPRARTQYTTIGGNSPQWLVNRAASAISKGEMDATLIVGAEAQRSSRIRRKLAQAEQTPQAGSAPAAAGSAATSPSAPCCETMPPFTTIGDPRAGAGQAELAAGLVAPVHIYPLFESAIAHRLGHSFAEQRRILGELMSGFTNVAAKHPFAWFPEAMQPSDLSGVTPSNRLIAEPYPKRMCAFLNVDQGAALVLTSLGVARASGLADEAVFCWSGADATDVWYPSERPDPGRSPGIAAAASAALDASRTGVDDLSAFDLYSCFPCAVEMAAEAISLSLDDHRGLTVTGGLPYFGGPGNNYTTHAIATMVDRLRDQGGSGLVTGLGWYATKHSVGIYGATPPEAGWHYGDTARDQAAIDASAVECLTELDAATTASASTARIRATAIASTVMYGPEGHVTGAPVIARLDDGRHVAAAADPDELAHLAGYSLVGESVDLEGNPLRYRPTG
ncbi:MAG: acetyl-CoA acetyltransferase [Acidimicrobiales bacterium]